MTEQPPGANAPGSRQLSPDGQWVWAGEKWVPNPAADPPHDRPEQLEFVRRGLMVGEQLHAVYDQMGVGTGFVGLTDIRLIMADRAKVTKKLALFSLPYDRIAELSVLANDSYVGDYFATSTLTVTSTASRSHAMLFRGPAKAKHAHDLILWYMTR